MAFVVFIGAVHVEKFETGPERRRGDFGLGIGDCGLRIGWVRQHPEHPNVEILLGLAVGIQRFEPRDKGVVVRVTDFTQTVGRGTAGIQKRYLKTGADHPECAGIFEVEFVENGGVHFGGIGAGAKVQYGIHIAVVAFEPAHKVVSVHLTPQFFAFEVAVFVGTRKIVDRQYIGISCFVEPLYHAGADKSRSTGNYYHVRGVRV